MAFPFFRKREVSAAAVHDPQSAKSEERQRIGDMVRSSDPGLAAFFGLDAAGVTDEVVNVDTAMKVPAFASAVNFLSRTLAALPIKAYRKTDAGRDAVGDSPIAALFGRAANDETDAFEFRRLFWVSLFTEGRAVAFIERNKRGDVINLWPLEVKSLRVQRRNGRRLYHYADAGRAVTYAASDVLDLTFSPHSDGLSARSPVYDNADTVGLYRASTRYGAKIFNNGGVPPFVVSGQFGGADAAGRAAGEVDRALKEAAEARRNAIALPSGHALDKLGFEPEKMQMTETKRFLVEEIARIFTMPPAFVQDLTNGTFSNVEQQDLQLVKHLIAHWAAAFEKQANLKIYGRRPSAEYLEHSLEGILRGDFVTRVNGYSAQLASGQATINEVRRLDNRPPVPGGDVPLVQGAMIPAEKAGAHLSDNTNEGKGNE